jgi:histidine triad (HIT) family protein
MVNINNLIQAVYFVKTILYPADWRLEKYLTQVSFLFHNRVQMASIFTRIINKEIPCYKIYENDKVISFLDINPVRDGHVLVVPKIEVDYFTEVPDDYYNAVFAAAKPIAKAIEKVIPCMRIGMLVEGVEVPHFHLHLIPIIENQPFLGVRHQANIDRMNELTNKIGKILEEQN